MNWKNHSKDIPEGSHAFLGASNYHWINYSEDKLRDVYMNLIAAKRGTQLHKFASDCIRLGQKLPNNHKTLNMYVNDAIGFKMRTEQPLKYSEFSFGTADAIILDKRNVLRIHDLKTGITPAKFEQLLVYTSLFCLEYDYKPNEFREIELRIYQNDEIEVFKPETDIIVPIMDKIVYFDRILRQIKEDGYEF